MAYQNVGTPRFYIDLYEWMNSVGNIKEVYKDNGVVMEGNPFGLNPSEPCVISHSSFVSELDTVNGTFGFKLNKALPRSITSKINYHGILGHNTASCEKPNLDGIEATDTAELENLHFRPSMNLTGHNGVYLGLHSNHGSDSNLKINYLVNCEGGGAIWSVGDIAYGFEDATIVESLDDVVNPEIGQLVILDNFGFQWDGNNWIDLELKGMKTGGNSGYFHALQDGFSLREAYPSNDDDVYRDKLYVVFGLDGGGDWLNTELTFNANCFTIGTYYDMPHSPELDVTMTIENDGFDAITTQGGTHLTNIRYNGAPMWKRADGSEIPPWTIGEPTAVGRRRGRRVWSMNFKYLSDKDLFASNYMSNNYTESSTGYDSADLTTDADGNDIFEYALNEDDSFHAQVLNKIGNGQRFIFQPDNNNFNPDQFAICQLQQDSLNIKQVGYGVYNISLKIREVW